MTNHDDDDMRDPLRAAFSDHQRAPRDIVPPRSSSAEELDVLADTTTTVTHYEMTEHGVTKHQERIEITRPITPKGNSQR